MDKDKKIDVGTSSLVDLKAELHRKQQESRTLRRGPDRPPSTSSKSSSKSKVWSKANAGVDKRDQRDREEVERETKDLDRSKTALEAKARVYDRLQTGTDALEDDDTNERFLVNFQQKAIDDVTRRRQRRQAAETGSSAEPPAGPVVADDEWVEFTDSLGRSRTVMRRDLAEYRRRDQESLREDDGQQSQTPELVSEDGRREQQRQLWERQELDNAAKRDVHYQDVLFNEARAHGAGYFAFSKDAEERARQRAELDELRGHTETQQSRAELARKRKNKQLKERLRKVRERKRLKLGLPIEDRFEKEESEEETVPAAPAEPTTEELSRKQEEEKKEQERERFIREWDLGKEGVSKKSVLTQEQWVEQQRKDRPEEFAPPVQYDPRGRGRGRGRGRPAADRAPQHSGAGSSGPRPSTAQETAPQGTVRPPADETGALPHTEQCSPETGPHPPAMGQVSTDVGQMPAFVGRTPPNMGQMPYMGQPPPSIEQMLPNMGQMTPNMGQITHIGQPPPSTGQMLPSMGQPPPNMGQMPPNMWQPPAGFSQQLAGSGCLPGQSAGDWGRPGGSRSAGPSSAAGGRPARVASYRARQAAAADLTDPDCVPPPTEEADRRAGPEVAPPATAEYYGGERRGRRLPAARADVGSAIEAGLALLSQDTEEKHSKTFDL